MDTPLPRKRLKRIERSDHARAITFGCYHGLALLGAPPLRDVFVNQLRITRVALLFELYAWVVMPNHVHLLMRTTPDGPEMPAILHRLKRSTAKVIIARWRELEAPILDRLTRGSRTRFWQPGGGYDRNIASHDALANEVRYIHMNPVRRGLTEGPADWVWSSARHYEGVGDSGVRIDPLPR